MIVNDRVHRAALFLLFSYFLFHVLGTWEYSLSENCIKWFTDDFFSLYNTLILKITKKY